MKTKKSLLSAVFILTTFCWAVTAGAHTLWIQTKEYNIDVGKKLYMFMGWGHYLPVADILDTTWIKGFAIHEPDGKKIEKKFPAEQKGYMVTPVEFDKEGTYKLTANIIPGYYTIYKKEGDDHMHHHFGPKTTIKGDCSEIPMSLSYEMYSKCIVTVGKPNGAANKLTNQRMEVALDKDPTKYRAGDTVNFTVYWEGKPVKHKAFFYAMPLGESPYFDDYTYKRVQLKNGKGSIKVHRNGIWHIKTAFKLAPAGDKLGKCDMMTYTATLTFQVDVEGSFPRPGFAF